MRVRVLALSAVLLLVAAACGDDSGGGGEASELRHTLQAGSTFVYDSEMALDFEIDLEIPPELLEGADFEFEPGDRITLDLVVGFDVTVEVEDGPEADQRLVRVTQIPTSLAGGAEFGGETIEFDLEHDGTSLSGTITTNGEVEEVSGSEDLFGDLGMGDASEVATEYVITDRGEVVSFSFGDDPALGDLDLEAFGALGELMSANLAAPVFGPVFPEGAVGVGSDWSDSTTIGEGALTLERSESHEVAASEERQGRETLRIESRVTTSGIEIGLGDLAELLSGLDTGGVEGELDVDPEQMVQLLELLGVEFTFAIDSNTATSTTWFDQAAGRVVELTTAAPVNLSLELRGFPELPGDISAVVSGEIRQTSTLQE